MENNTRIRKKRKSSEPEDHESKRSKEKENGFDFTQEVST